MAELETNVNVNPEQAEPETTVTETETNDNAEIARLKAELAKQKAAMDKATKEAGDYKKQLRARQSAEEAAAEAEKERQEAMEKELAELRKERAVANTSKRVFTFIQNEAVATEIANALYGAEDVDAAIDAISKAWAGREKALKIEYGRVPAPGVGSGDGPTITKEQLDMMTLAERVEFSNKHPDEYRKLMGR